MAASDAPGMNFRRASFLGKPCLLTCRRGWLGALVSKEDGANEAAPEPPGGARRGGVNWRGAQSKRREAPEASERKRRQPPPPWEHAPPLHRKMWVRSNQLFKPKLTHPDPRVLRAWLGRSKMGYGGAEAPASAKPVFKGGGGGARRQIRKRKADSDEEDDKSAAPAALQALAPQATPAGAGAAAPGDHPQHVSRCMVW